MSLIPTLDGGIWGLSRLVNLNIKFYCLFPGEIFPFKEIHQINPNNLIGCVITAHHTNWLHVRLVGTIWLILCVCVCVSVQVVFQVVICACSAWAAEYAFLTAWWSLNSKKNCHERDWKIWCLIFSMRILCAIPLRKHWASFRVTSCYLNLIAWIHQQ